MEQQAGKGVSTTDITKLMTYVVANKPKNEMCVVEKTISFSTLEAGLDLNINVGDYFAVGKKFIAFSVPYTVKLFLVDHEGNYLSSDEARVPDEGYGKYVENIVLSKDDSLLGVLFSGGIIEIYETTPKLRYIKSYFADINKDSRGFTRIAFLAENNNYLLMRGPHQSTSEIILMDGSSHSELRRWTDSSKRWFQMHVYTSKGKEQVYLVDCNHGYNICRFDPTQGGPPTPTKITIGSQANRQVALHPTLPVFAAGVTYPTKKIYVYNLDAEETIATIDASDLCSYSYMSFAGKDGEYLVARLDAKQATSKFFTWIDQGGHALEVDTANLYQTYHWANKGLYTKGKTGLLDKYIFSTQPVVPTKKDFGNEKLWTNEELRSLFQSESRIPPQFGDTTQLNLAEGPMEGKISHDGKMLAGASKITLLIYDLATGKLLSSAQDEFHAEHANEIVYMETIGWSSNDEYVMTKARDIISVWKVQPEVTLENTIFGDLTREDLGFVGGGFLSNGNYIVMRGPNMKSSVIELYSEGHELIRRWISPNRYSRLHIYYSADGGMDRVYLVNSDHFTSLAIYTLDVTSNDPPKPTKMNLIDWPSELIMSPNMPLLAAAKGLPKEGDAFLIYNLQTEELISSGEVLNDTYSSAFFGEHSQYLLTRGSEYARVDVRSTDTFEILATLPAQGQSYYCQGNLYHVHGGKVVKRVLNTN